MAKLTIQQLKQRWETEEGASLLKIVIKAIIKGRDLTEISSLKHHEGKIDLRGISLPKEYERFFNYKTSKYIKWVDKSIKFKSCKLDNIDFSYSDIQATSWEKCSFIACLFYQVDARTITFTACDFQDVIFKNTRFSYGYLNIRSGKLSGSFKNVSFIKSQFSETLFSFPIFDSCLFEDCNFYAADFDGSRFSNTKFKGVLNCPWFRKHAKNEFEPNYFFNRIDKIKFSNEMLNVDFSEATLEYVGFSDDLDLKNCKLPLNIKIERFEQFKSGYFVSTVTTKDPAQT
ncbi:MAG: pentapeptide repeat-containing protein [Acinetobacter sp.]|nr:MAG: pentapeptide repeat-containing protein [Acinetobacter sp.]